MDRYFTAPPLDDLTSPTDAAQRQAVELVNAALPNSEVVVLPGQQHIAHLSNPEMLAGEVMRFLQG